MKKITKTLMGVSSLGLAAAGAAVGATTITNSIKTHSRQMNVNKMIKKSGAVSKKMPVEDNDQPLTDTPAFNIGDKSWTKARLDNACVWVGMASPDLYFNFIVQKDIYLVQFDDQHDNKWVKEEWASLREAALGSSKISKDGEGLIDNIKLGLGKFDSKGKLGFGTITYQNATIWNYTQNAYAVNDNKWDSKNANENLNDPLAGNSFTWRSQSILFNADVNGHSHFEMTYSIDDGKSFYDAIQIKRNKTGGTFSLRMDPAQTFTFRLSVKLVDDGMGPNGAWDSFYQGDDTTSQVPITDTMSSDTVSDAQQVAGIINPIITLTDDEENYFFNNQQASSFDIKLDSKHLQIQRYDGSLIGDSPTGDDIYSFLSNNKATAAVGGLFTGYIKDPVIDLTGDDNNGDPAILRIWNYSDGYHKGSLVNASIQLFGQDVGLNFSYWA